MIPIFQAKFLECMTHMYPSGLGGNLDDVKHQLRDLIRTFSMGWVESLMANDQPEAVVVYTREWKYLADLNWWPDRSWMWWP